MRFWCCRLWVLGRGPRFFFSKCCICSKISTKHRVPSLRAVVFDLSLSVFIFTFFRLFFLLLLNRPQRDTSTPHALTQRHKSISFKGGGGRQKLKISSTSWFRPFLFFRFILLLRKCSPNSRKRRKTKGKNDAITFVYRTTGGDFKKKQNQKHIIFCSYRKRDWNRCCQSSKPVGEGSRDDLECINSLIPKIDAESKKPSKNKGPQANKKVA